MASTGGAVQSGAERPQLVLAAPAGGTSPAFQSLPQRKMFNSDDSSTGPQSSKQRKVEKSFIHMSSYDFLVPFSTNISGNKMKISQTPKFGNEKVTDNVHLLRPTMKLKLKYKENKSNSFNTPAEEDQDDIQAIREVPWDKQTGILVTPERIESPKSSEECIPGLKNFSVVNKLQNMSEAKSSTYPDLTKIPRSKSALYETVRVYEKKYFECFRHCMGTNRRPLGGSTNDKGTKSKKVPVVEEIDLTEESEDNDISEIKVVKLKDKPPPKMGVLQPLCFTCHNEKLCTDILEEQIKKQLKITDVSLHDDILDDEPQLPKLTPAMESIVSAAFRPDPRSEVLVEAFSLKITRYDVQSLAGTNWLNDEVINFYMNLLIERGKNDNYPSVYAFNTFFYPKLASSGYSSLKRWTRKVDVFAHDILIVPVHLGMHWCMAAIDFRNKSICYYDSLGAPNNQCLTLLMKYLERESMDKKRIPFDSEGWYVENAKNIPLQTNRCDCGMFSCTYAEFVARNATFSFSQKEMPYFRRKMVYEILSKKLML